LVLNNAASMEGKNLNFFRNAIRYKLTDTISYETYWRTLGEGLKGVRRVWVSPDGVYHQVSLATLFNKRTQKFLMDEIDLRVVNSTGDLLQTEPPYTNNPGKFALIGYPDFGDPASTGELLQDRSMNLNNVPPLPGTKDELAGVANLLEAKGISMTKLIGSEATEETVKSVSNPYVLHIATHGYFLKDDRSGTSNEFQFQQQHAAVSPMMRSGLLLTGCCNRPVVRPGTEEDGILTAYEASSLSLSGTRLVVLSACETGLGEISYGEGVYGLQRAFFEAGVPSLMMSLWKVDDRATQRLMVLFYQYWLVSGSAQDALRKAQAELKKEFPEPYYWGAFIAVGK
jgi:CHAT domain-containing protein